MLLKLLLASLTFASLTFVVGAATDSYSRNDFPPEFIFGAATSAFQVEGAADEDGRTPSIFDTFALTAYSTGGYKSRACDQYHKYKEDVGLMAGLGLDAYRFSISWSRLIPNGRGPVNPKGLEYYNNLINELISHGIQPHVTLHHSDLPQALEDEYGGWLNRRIVKDFKTYADVCFREFGDRVKYWTTLNEPNVFVIGGYDLGGLPPGRCSSYIANCSTGNSSTEPYIAAHNILLAHASTATLYRKKYQEKQRGTIGINLITFAFLPQTNATEDLSATQRTQDVWMGWFLNPLMFGEYPDTMKKNVGARLPSFTENESNMLKGSIDFVGVNYYYTLHVKNSPSSPQVKDTDVLTDMRIQVDGEIIGAEYPIKDGGLRRVVEYLKHTYGSNLPIYIHENGQQTPRNSSLDDYSRVMYLQEHIKAVLDEVRNGSNVKGYFVWSLLDLFELLTGYESSFGLYYVDLNDPNLRRLPKLSAKWYSHFLRRSSMDLITMELEEKVPRRALNA